MSHPFDNRAGIAQAVREAQAHLRPPPDMLPSVYAEQAVRIPAGNVIPGLIRFDNAPYQREPLDMTVNPDCRRITLMWGAQVGKAVALDTVLPTPGGLRPMEDIAAGDMVIADNGEPCRVVFATEPMVDRPCYRITFDDGASLVCDEEHQWTVIDRGHQIRGISTNRERTLTVGEMLDPHRRSRAQGRARYSIPNCAAIDLPDAELPVDPYVYGCWLGDGSVSDGQIVFHAADFWMAQEFERRGYLIYGREKDRRNKNVIYWRLVRADGQPLAKLLRENGLRQKTSIDPRYLVASVAQRRALLAGIMDTDGHVGKEGHAQLLAKSEQFARDAAHLICSLGIKARIKPVRKSCTYLGEERAGIYWAVSFRAYVGDGAFALPRKAGAVKRANAGKVYLRKSESRERRIVSIEPVDSVPVKCIQVDSPRSLYLVGRECIPTHNTMLALCAQAYRIEQNPTSQMMMQPSQGDLQTWLQTKFNPMVEANTGLQKLIAPPRGRKGVNNDRMKSYPGGFLMFAWSGSPKTMRGRSAPFIVADETDGYDRVAEGHPVSLLVQRAASFGDDGLLLEISTPTFKGASWIEAAFEEGDRRRFHVACPHCGRHQTLRWSQVTWGKHADGEADPDSAAYLCEAEDCGTLWTDGERWSAIRVAEAVGAGWKAERVWRGHASYHLNELYSTFRKLSHIVQSFVDKRAANDLRSFVNVSLAETWEEQGEQVKSGTLMERVERYRAPVPAGGLVLTVGIDMQQDRLELEVVAWGLGEESWSIEYQVIWGDVLRPEVWQELDDFLSRTWLHQSGAQLPISGACLDTGGTNGMTTAAYDYAKGKTGRRLFAIKGVDGWGRPVVAAPSRKRTGRGQRKVDLFLVGTDEAKMIVAKRWGIQQPGPGYCHFPEDRDPEWFAQATAEKLVTKHIRGFGHRAWHKTRPRNEALDCRVYAYAALKIINPNIARAAKRLACDEEEDGDVTPSPSAPTKAAQTKLPTPEVAEIEGPPEEPEGKDRQPGARRAAPARHRRQKSSWMKRW